MRHAQDVLENPPRPLRTGFEIAAMRIADAWLESRRIATTTADYRMAREFLEQTGWEVEQRPGLTVRVLRGSTCSDDIPREEMVAIALRLVLRQITQQPLLPPTSEQAPAAA